MKKLALVLAAAAAMSFCQLTRAQDSTGKTEKVTGVLIDDHCATKMMKNEDPQKAAEKHPASCCNKCIDGGASVVLISGKDELKLDSKGQELAKEMLKKDGAKTEVTVTGEKEGNTLKVTSIEPAAKE
jgi:hypothetical protein